MAVFTFCSAAGSPGVTSTVLGLAMGWPRPVLVVEADPTGGSGILAGFFGGMVDHQGLADLVLAQRNNVLADTLPRVLLPIEGSGVSVLVGARSHDQAAGFSRLWEPLLGVLRDVGAAGQDVLVDAGRLGLASWPRPLVTGSDVTVLVTRSGLPALVAARSWAAGLAGDVLPGHDVRVLLVGAGRPYRASEVARTLGVRVVGSLAWDPARAAVFGEGAAKPRPRWGGERAAGRAFARSAYLGSLHSVGEALRQVAEGSSRGQLLGGMIAARTVDEAPA